LRHTFATWLAQSGAHPKLMQELCRHSNVELTLKVYTHMRMEDERKAVAGLPDLTAQRQAMQATGTEDLGASLGSAGDSPGFSVPQDNPKQPSQTDVASNPPTRLESTESAPEQGSEADESWRWRRDSNPRVTDLQSYLAVGCESA
jgi:hypothetical protein